MHHHHGGHSPLRALAIACALLGAFAATPLAAQGNVLLLVADDLGTDAVRCYGNPAAPPTPNLDSLAASGVRFLAAHTSPTCSPSRAAIMTGRHGYRTGITGTLGGGEPGIDPAETLLPVALQGAGVAAALVGKWHLGVRYGNLTPNTLGWPHFVGAIDGSIPSYTAWPKVRNGVVATSTRYATSDQVDEALAWIAGRTSPWVLMVAFHAPHQPFHAPPAGLHTQHLNGLDPATSPQPFFRAMVQAMDTEIGRLLAGLGPARANTNIVFVADNGTDGVVAPPPQGPDRAKGSLYQGGTRVPLIVAGPAVANPGRTIAALAHTVDLFPTALQLANVPLPGPNTARPLDGVSLVPLLANTATSVRTSVYCEITGTPLGGGYAVKDGRYELLRFLQHGPQRQELYDLAVDPDEQNDLLAGPQTAAVAVERQRLENLLASYRRDGWVEAYGVGCPGALGLPTLRAQTMPKLGDWLYLQVANAPVQQSPFSIVAWGDSRTRIGTIPLPLDLSPFGLVGCALLQNYLGAMFVSPQTGYTREWITATPSLLGAELYVQAVVAEAGANPVGIIGSRGLRCVIGN